jgi:hypothetical protein
MHTGTFGSPCNCAEIPYIGYIVKHQDKRILSLFKKGCYNFLKIKCRLYRDHGYHTLVIYPADPVELFNRNKLERDTMCFRRFTRE